MLWNNLMSGFISWRVQISRQLPSRSCVKLNLQPSSAPPTPVSGLTASGAASAKVNSWRMLIFP
jgi:hypothetical protein